MSFPAVGVDAFSSPASTSSSLPPTPDRIRTAIHGDIICPRLRSSTTRDVFQSIVKGRKSWKTLRGNGEAVWPPELEAALLEGLESYQPDDSRETRLLGRFPMRNRFISDYIFRVTGKRRTAKQVGSRLQQLRDTCGGKRLLALLSPCRREQAPSHRSSAAYMRELQRCGRPQLTCDVSSASSDTSSVYSPTTPLDCEPTTPFFEQPQPPRSLICIDILPEEAAYPPPSPSASSCSSSSSFSNPPSPSPKRDTNSSSTDISMSPTCTTPMDPAMNFNCDTVFRPSPHPRPIKTIDPTVTFVAQSPITAESFFTVYSDNSPVYQETTALVLVPPSCENPEAETSLLYSTSLVPGYWKSISESVDPTCFTIVQEVIQNTNTVSSSVMFSAVYKFQYPQGCLTRQTSPSPVAEATSMVSPQNLSPSVQSESYTDLPLDYFLMEATAFTDPFNAKHENLYELMNPSFEMEGGWVVPPAHSNGSNPLCVPTSVHYQQEYPSFVL